MQADLDAGHLNFPALDREFHALIISRMKNRFAIKHLDVVTFVFHYHYRWDRDGQKARVMCSLAQHIAILEALLAADLPEATRRLTDHLATARRSLIERFPAT